MKYKFIIAVLLIGIIMGFTKSPKSDFRPPGTVEIVDNFFFDAREICNIDWKEYLSYLEQHEGIKSFTYKNAHPDFEVWKSNGIDNTHFKKEYYSNPAYDEYPVVGVSHAQAEAYCKWRTKAVKTMISKNNFNSPSKFEYRLPSKTEWELVSDGGYSIKSKKLIRKKYKGLDKSSHMKILNNMKFSDGDTFTLPGPARSYLPNKYGVYNIFGNVAEMVSEPGIAMGGSFNDYYQEIVPSNKPIAYEGPSNWLGFRCVCEIIEN